VAVVGDVILDEYITGEINRISPEAPVGVLDCDSEEFLLGGAANVAANVVRLGGRAFLLWVAGDDADAMSLKLLLKKNGIDHAGLVTVKDRPTIKKSRIMARRQQLLRIDREKRREISGETEKKILVNFKKILPSVDGVIISDYNKGLLTKSLLRDIISLVKKSGKHLVVDPKGDSFAKYRGAGYITPNRRELERASRMECDDIKKVEKAARSIIRKHSIGNVLATLGPDGMALVGKNGKVKSFPTVAKEVFDVTGAGDTVVAVFTVSLLGGMLPDEAVSLANHAGGLQVGHLGAVGIGKAELEKSLAGTAGFEESKIVDVAEAAEIAEHMRRKNKKVVFTNGCFDLIHFGHIQYLQKAKKLGHRLVVGLNSDASVKKLKGPGRPLLNEHDRAHVLAALDCVDLVVIFDAKTPIKIIKAVKPDLLVKGGDYELDQIVGHTEVKKWGGRTLTIPYIKGNSTTGIIQKIIRHQKAKQ